MRFAVGFVFVESSHSRRSGKHLCFCVMFAKKKKKGLYFGKLSHIYYVQTSQLHFEDIVTENWSSQM